MNRLALFGLLLKDALRGWVEHRVQRLGASLAFYTTLALAPLTIIAIAIAGSFFGEEAARGGIVEQIEHVVGRDGAIMIESLLAHANEPQPSRIATMFSVGVLVFCAMGVFAELKDSLDTIWEVDRKTQNGWWLMVKTQLLAFTLVVGSGLLFLTSLLLTGLLAAGTDFLDQWLPIPAWTAHLLDNTVTFLIVTLLFAMIFKLLPDVSVKWKDVWIGAIVTAVLFTIGKYLIGFYIGRAHIGSIYGAAGSLVVLLVWTYYSSLILFFGAELTSSYARHFSKKPIEPTRKAQPRKQSKSSR